MKIKQAYEKYKIMPSLRLHMYRVTAVAKIICDNSKEDIDSEDILKAMLLHDMGNILKFDLTLFPEFLEPEGLNYWEKAKLEYKEKYGQDEHLATYKIAEELNPPTRVMELLKSVGFSESKKNFETKDIGKKICCYSDQRVTPFGIVPLQSRLNEGRDRYAYNKLARKDEEFEKGAKYLSLIEEQIFGKCNITPEFITDEKVNDVIGTGYLHEIEI